MNLQHAQTAPDTPRYAVCDPQGRPMQATFGVSPTHSQDLFARQFDIPWRRAKAEGYEVYEALASRPTPSSPH